MVKYGVKIHVYIHAYIHIKDFVKINKLRKVFRTRTCAVWFLSNVTSIVIFVVVYFKSKQQRGW